MSNSSGGRAAPRLVIDTATRQSTVAIGEGRQLLAESSHESRHHHGAVLLEQIDEVLVAAGVSRSDLAAIGVGIGPGSFTGLRVGLATAKTLAYLQDVPICGLNSGDALAL